ncbi:NADPH-dependent diflavin oxidoreductase 1-like isoform X2 [Varroa jacobsoni]|uniref:NADPH-dependent diflavin oxidoreductase 1 n=2 Tax=Varroa TaxID=62624 RepID=A0A7M7L435_VARDE|nr:NADPH-dependent diflavin oxidoreductase 1-like isoform X1 [Varroa destructor]XP_022669882.1 NADPH-dependent diflavin oxidoreductase 1-like isoform X1 [Varroa destructor]XP_022669883.1 NADPH-dependent diflavin oxidoreductase 1-like isoform X1 [Varroa destructor]XP_022669885.1 NADPH-dependent diflavin oxidoreductase 1-like isoform X1 [Varroa destructor]XP_022669886.1 NADPH-dependent diflavin oxidoreductase 1-like isoform X1 [Varroa destructor]XP_022669887.1 NADPH-dependent diflavin oxidoreduc
MSQNDRPGLLNKISFSKRHLGMEQPRNDEKGGRNIAKGRCVFPRLVILYASQTGTAEDCAERVSREAQRRHFSSVVVMSCDEYPIEKIFDEKLILFFIATTGQGDHPDNMRSFFRSILNRKLQSGDFGHIEFAVCGLGDSSYQKFNFSAKKVFRRLIQLGARKLIEPVWADEQHDLGVDGLIDPWMEKFWTASAHLTTNPLRPPLPDVMPSPKYSVVLYDESELDQSGPADAMDETININGSEFHLTSTDQLSKSPLRSTGSWPYVSVRVLSQERVTTEDHFQDVRLLRLAYSDQPCAAPGDVAVILPKNTSDKIQACLDLFPHINPDQPVTLKDGTTSLPPHLRTKWTTFRKLVTNYFDLNFIPKRSFFSVYKHFCRPMDTLNATEKAVATDSQVASQLEQYWEKLDEFSRADGQPELMDYTIKHKRTVLEVFEDFPIITKRLRLQDLLTLIPAIRPRYYSIASSTLKHRGEIHVLYAVVDFKTMLKKPRTGLCTQFLKNLKTGNIVNLYIRKGTFQFPLIEAEEPKKLQKKVIMVGPGTGVAPFRAFIQECAFVGGASEPMILFFGCRNSLKDYYFADEWHDLEKRKILRVVTAFSRDQEHKIYVQERIKEHKDELLKIAEDENSLAVYICGNAARMVEDVLKTLQEIWGSDRVQRMQNKKLIQIEAWA